MPQRDLVLPGIVTFNNVKECRYYLAGGATPHGMEASRQAKQHLSVAVHEPGINRLVLDPVGVSASYTVKGEVWFHASVMFIGGIETWSYQVSDWAASSRGFREALRFTLVHTEQESTAVLSWSQYSKSLPQDSDPVNRVAVGFTAGKKPKLIWDTREGLRPLPARAHQFVNGHLGSLAKGVDILDTPAGTTELVCNTKLSITRGLIWKSRHFILEYLQLLQRLREPLQGYANRLKIGGCGYLSKP